TLYPFGIKDKDNNSLLPNPGSETAEYRAILREIDRMADAFDALSDLTLAESVYQVAKGNYKRVNAVSEAIASGTAPPEPQIVNTPRSGKVITHRVVWNLNPIDSRNLTSPSAISAALPAGWQNITASPAMLANPAINYLLGSILGHPTDIRFQIGTNPQQLTSQSIADLDIHAIDLIRLMDGEVGGGDLERLIAYRFSMANNLGNDPEITISFKDRDPAWTPNVRTLFELAPMINSLQELISDSKGTFADDLIIPGDSVTNPGGLIPAEMAHRYTAVHSALTNIDQFLQNVLYDANDKLKTSLSDPEIDGLRNIMWTASTYGVSNAIPVNRVGYDTDLALALLNQGDTVAKVIRKRLAEANKAIAKITNDSTQKELIGAYEKALAALFDKGFKAIPLFELRNEAELVQTGLQSAHLLRHEPDFPMETWSHSVSKVREKMRQLELVNTYSHAFDSQFPSKSVVQIPYEQDDYWFGQTFPADYDPENEKLSLIVLNLARWNSGPVQCGLVIDEWVETIPDKEELTGIAMHYDQPDARPPQSILLAVSPSDTSKWDWEDLVYTLRDTLDLARIRAVEPKHIQKSAFSHVLPAIVAETQLPEATGLDMHVEVFYRRNNLEIES
ncbi:MAG: hypothetical protein AAF598_03790, partial [Bacteroidota bacterium]